MRTPAGTATGPAFEEGRIRKHARSLFSVPFQLHLLDVKGLHAVHGITLDISEGGLGALVQGQLRVGEAVQIHVPVGAMTFSTLAFVRHTSGIRSGFEFLGSTRTSENI
jgi:hypothetical protein